MNRHLRPFAGLCICAGIVVGGYVLVPAPDVMAKPSAGRERPYSPPVARPETTISSARPPVPLLVTRHTTFFVEEAQPATTTAALVTEPQDKPEKSESSATAAKAMIEADGYKNVSALVKAPDGTWAGVAMRGATQVAIRVDAGGSVSTQ